MAVIILTNSLIRAGDECAVILKRLKKQDNKAYGTVFSTIALERYPVRRDSLAKGNLIAVLAFILFLSICGIAQAAEDAFRQADAAMVSKQYFQARDLYRQVFVSAKDAADSSRALLGIAKSDYYLKNYYESDINLKRFFKLYKGSPHANEAHLLWGIDLMRTGKYKEAEEQLSMVRGELQEKADIARAELQFNLGETAKAEGLLLRIDRKIYENDPRVLYLRAMILSRQGKHDQAVQIINKIPDEALKAEDMSVGKAAIYYNARKFADAKKMLNAIISAPSSRIEDMQAKKTLFEIYSAENNDDAALKLAIELMGYEASDDLRLKVISLYEKKGDLDSAFRYITYLSNKKTRSDELEKRLKKMQEDKDPKADEYLLKYFIYLSIDSPYVIEASKYMEEKGYKEQAQRLLRKASRGRYGPQASIALAQMFIQDQKFSEAKKILTPITTDANYSGQASLMLYDILEREGNLKAAEEYRSRAVRVLTLQKDYAKVGDLYMKAGNSAEALKFYLRASHDGDASSMLKAADLYYVSGKRDAARMYYKKSLDSGLKEPKNIQWADYQYGKLTRSDEYLKKAEQGGGAVSEAAGFLRVEK